MTKADILKTIRDLEDYLNNAECEIEDLKVQIRGLYMQGTHISFESLEEAHAINKTKVCVDTSRMIGYIPKDTWKFNTNSSQYIQVDKNHLLQILNDFPEDEVFLEIGDNTTPMIIATKRRQYILVPRME